MKQLMKIGPSSVMTHVGVLCELNMLMIKSFGGGGAAILVHKDKYNLLQIME